MPIGIFKNIQEQIYAETLIIEQHFHNDEIWLGAGAVQDSLTGYQLTSGNNLFGNAILLLDTDDTPIIAGRTDFDLHRIFITQISTATTMYIRLIHGTGTVEQAEAERCYTTVPFASSGLGSNLKGDPSNFIFNKVPVHEKVWARCKNVTNLATISILVGLHEYPSWEHCI